MTETELKLEYKECEPKQDGIAVIIAAAGSSSRMSGLNKQFIKIGGIPVIARTMLCFERCDSVSKIIIAAREDDIPEIQLLADRYMISKLTDIVSGGSCRQDSVKKAFSVLDSKDKKVLIHDGARPLVSDSVIKSVVSSLEKYDAVTCAVKVKDTVKRIDSDGFAVETPNRESLVAVQTPQGVDVEKYRAAMQKAGDLSLFTDDMSIMEQAGYSVMTVNGSYQNIKITTREDLAAAEAFIAGNDEE